MNPRARALTVGVGVAMAASALGAVPAEAAPKKKRPDLVVRSVTVSPSTVKVGGTLRIRDTTRNKGRKAAKRSVTRYVLSKNKLLDRRDVRLRDRAVKRLAPRRQHRSKVITVRVPATTKPGTYWLLACADARTKVRESNERNNCRAAGRRVTLAPAIVQNGSVKVSVSARVDVAYRGHHGSDGFDTVEKDDTRLQGTGTGYLWVKNGTPQFLTWTWSRATVSGTETYASEGQTNTDCPWEADARITGSTAVDVTPHGAVTGGVVLFPDYVDGPKASFGLSQKIASRVTPRIDCRGENIGNVSPVPTLELRQYWWAKKPTYSVSWSRDLSTVSWREHGENNYRSAGGTSFEDKSYQADGVLTLTPIG